MLPDYLLMAPEINSARIYAGPRSGSMWAAASAWDVLATELALAASSFQSTVSTLTSGAWLGPASMTMAAAAAPYVAWLTASSANAEVVANQARLTAGAFEAAFTATVPPAVVAANRTLLATLIATNILGQNTAAIAATEAEYAEMWAQDVAAMTGYDAGATAAAAQWTPFGNPPLTLTSVAAPSFTSAGQQLFSSLGQTLSNSASKLQMLSAPAQLAMEPLNMVMGQVMTGANPLTSGAAGSMPALAPGLVAQVGPVAGGASTVQLASRVVSAGVGHAASVGPLSVPPSWPAATAAPPAPTAAAASGTGVGQVAPAGPRMPSLPSMGMPARGIGAVTPAVAAARKGALSRQVPG
ncbi:PPE family protein [Mycobacterium rhizamassiliense]|uniref:PPE family protein n=1 Tax=Mycobacterium rhizamassiliense TaxID=1841860 RepID=A0A2U3P0L3_9MYCO|nr:PPE family protein [Mycobacterium rhizamassiliense]SPM37303.1 PPE family protein [Mycobacterium rhizamassiliense]